MTSSEELRRIDIEGDMAIVLLFFFEGCDCRFDGFFARFEISVFRQADSKHSDMLIRHLAHCRCIWTDYVHILKSTADVFRHPISPIFVGILDGELYDS